MCQQNTTAPAANSEAPELGYACQKSHAKQSKQHTLSSCQYRDASLQQIICTLLHPCASFSMTIDVVAGSIILAFYTRKSAAKLLLLTALSLAGLSGAASVLGHSILLCSFRSRHMPAVSCVKEAFSAALGVLRILTAASVRGSPSSGSCLTGGSWPLMSVLTDTDQVMAPPLIVTFASCG